MKAAFYHLFSASFATIIFLICSNSMKAQAPNRMSYQSVIRNSSNNLVVNQSVRIKVSILRNTTSGEVAYSEIHTVTTNANGLATLEIGGGANASGSFSGIDWSKDNYFLKTETDPTGGTNYTITGTAQLLSVPYALYSSLSGNGIPPGGNQEQLLTMCNGVPTWTTNGKCPGTINALNCTDITISGILTAGKAACDETSVSLSYTGGNGGIYNSQTFSSTLVTGLTATISSGTLQNGNGSINFTISGTPSAAGSANFNVLLGGKSCIISLPVISGSPFNTNLIYGEVTDIDNNTYKTIQIDESIWMAENLRVSRYQNGDPIQNISNNTDWKNNNTGALCSYNNNNQNDIPYGKLYNWFAVFNSKKICPAGWHIPTDTEWSGLESFLGGNSIAGGKMKSTGTKYWNCPNGGADNSSGFSALPGGKRDADGIFFDINTGGNWWTATDYEPEFALNRTLSYLNGFFEFNGELKSSGFSVRCVKD